MLSVEIIKLAIIVKQKRDIGSTCALSNCRFFLISAKVKRSLAPPTFEEKWKSHSLQQPIFKNYYQFLTNLFSNKIIRCKLWSCKMSTFSKFNISICVSYFKNQIESGFETKILCLTFSLCSNQNALKSNFFKLSNCTKVKNGVGFKSSFISL